jgi:hypothetical protein
VLAPPPRRVERGRGSHPVPAGLQAALAGYTVGADVPEGITGRVDRAQVKHEQGYDLLVQPGEVSLVGADPRGLYYGLMTLRQLVRQADRAGRIPCLRIEDWPEYPVRGILLDISRDRVPTMETLKRLIDLWAELKLNQAQLYTEHTFAYSGHEVVWKDASPITPAEAEELDRYCLERAMELVPNQNSFGHMERWLRHPEYRQLADATGGFPDPWGGWRTEPTTLNPLDPGSIELLSGLYDQLLPHFKSSLLNVGADEPIDLGHGRSREACLALGAGRVYLEFISKIHEQVSRRGKTMQCYADILVRYPELVREIPRDLIALDWGYEADHPFAGECRLLAGAGSRFYVCPGTSSWNSIGGRWANARANIRSAAREGLAVGAAGFLLTDWGDNGHWQQLPVSFPAYVYGSAAAWNPAGAEELDVAEFLSRQVFLDETGGAARALLELGEVGENDRARLPNATILGVLLLLPLQPYYRKALELYRGYGFERERARIEAALGLLSGARLEAADGKLLREELQLTAHLLKHATDLGRARLATPSLAMAEMAESERRRLAQELADLSAGYRRLWLARSRPGGLPDSAGRMAALMDSYGNPG